MTDRLETMTAADISAAYATGALGPVEITRHLLERIEELNARLRASEFR